MCTKYISISFEFIFLVHGLDLIVTFIRSCVVLVGEDPGFPEQPAAANHSVSEKHEPVW